LPFGNDFVFCMYTSTPRSNEFQWIIKKPHLIHGQDCSLGKGEPSSSLIAHGGDKFFKKIWKAFQFPILVSSVVRLVPRVFRFSKSHVSWKFVAVYFFFIKCGPLDLNHLIHACFIKIYTVWLNAHSIWFNDYDWIIIYVTLIYG
jgi:hypothetical protein